jgi:two-component system, LytTR family, response regulator
MINAVLIDDEPKNIRILSKLLQDYCPEVHVAGTAENHQDAIETISRLRPDLIFLDIEMPDGNAFDLLNRLMPVKSEIVFVTAHENYALKAFRYSALDYMLKPVSIESLRQAVAKAEKRIGEKNINERLDNFLKNQDEKYSFSRIALPVKNGIEFFEFADIVFCKAEGPYTRFEFTNKQALLVSGSLKEYEELLPAVSFCRIHNSYLVNLNHIKKYHKGKGGSVEMSNGVSIEVSLRKRDEFINRLRM